MYETRIFFVLDNLDASLRSQLTLSNSLFSKTLFPNLGEVPSFSNSSGAINDVPEERTDEYFLLESCPGAKTIGLKSRGGGKKSTLELKTTIESDDGVLSSLASRGKNPDNDTADPPPLAYWIKSRKKGKFDPSDPAVVLNFLQTSCSPEQQGHAQTVADWIQQRIDSRRLPLPFVQTSKSRLTTYVDQGNISIEEANVQLTLMDGNDYDDEGEPGENNNNNNNKTRVIQARSFAAESASASAKLQDVANHWNERFDQAVAVVVDDDESNDTKNKKNGGSCAAPAIPMMVASYPEMVLKVPQIFAQHLGYQRGPPP